MSFVQISIVSFFQLGLDSIRCLDFNSIQICWKSLTWKCETTYLAFLMKSFIIERENLSLLKEGLTCRYSLVNFCHLFFNRIGLPYKATVVVVKVKVSYCIGFCIIVAFSSPRILCVFISYSSRLRNSRGCFIFINLWDF